jgi:hypothetical protein
MRPSLAATLLLSLLALCGCDTQVTLVRGGTGILRVRFVVETVAPAPGSVEVGPLSQFRVTFSRPIDRDSSVDRPIRMIRLPEGVLASGLVRYEPAPIAKGETDADRVDRTIVWTPDDPMIPGRVYRLEISEDVVSIDGDLLGLVTVTDEGAAIPAIFDTFANPPVLDSAITADATSSTSIEARWSAAVDDVTAVEDLVYEVFAVTDKKPIDLSQPALRTERGALQALVVGLDAGTEYRIVVRAIDAVGNASAPSDEVRATTEQIIDLDAPLFGGIVNLEIVSPTELRVTWEAAMDAVDGSELLRYNVYLAVDPGGQDFDGPCLPEAGGMCQSSAPGATELTIGDLEPDSTIHVVVRAQDTAGNESSNVDELAATTPISFERQILPILTNPARGCTISGACHRGNTPRDELNLETYDGLMAGGISQRLGLRPDMIVPGEEISDDMQSYFLWRTDTTNNNFEGPRMPLGRSEIPSSEFDTIKRWIVQGALDN